MWWHQLSHILLPNSSHYLVSSERIDVVIRKVESSSFFSFWRRRLTSMHACMLWSPIHEKKTIYSYGRFNNVHGRRKKNAVKLTYQTTCTCSDPCIGVRTLMSRWHARTHVWATVALRPARWHRWHIFEQPITVSPTINDLRFAVESDK
jgi:hypothetical protein